jgi:hypothetical protein
MSDLRFSNDPRQPRRSEAFSLPPDDAIDALVNEVLDAESEGRNAQSLMLIRKGVTEYPGFGARLAATRAAIKGLRSPVFVPDQRTEVLVEVNTLRPFLSRHERRQISASRLAIAAAVVLAASLMAILQRSYPQLAPQQPAPVGTLVDASRADASATVQSLTDAVADLRENIAAPVSTVIGPPEPLPAYAPLSLGSIAPYELEPRASLRLPTSQPPRGRTIAVLPAPAREPLLMLDEGPIMLLSTHNTHAPVRTSPWPELLHIDEDGVVIFGQPPQAPPLGVLRE